MLYLCLIITFILKTDNYYFFKYFLIFHKYKFKAAFPNCYIQNASKSCLSGVIVSVFAIRLKVRGFKHGQGNGFLRIIKIHSMPSFRGKVKLEAPCHKTLRHVKNSTNMKETFCYRLLISYANAHLF
jgi:hypothetical protein